MNNLENYYYKKLELDVIFNLLQNEFILDDNKMALETLKPLRTVDECESALKDTDEALQVLTKYQSVEILFTSKLREILDFTHKDGILNGEELYQVLALYYSINSFRRLTDITIKNKESYDILNNHLESLILDEGLHELLVKTVDETGYILDTASQTLKNLRKKLASIDTKIKSKLNELMITHAQELSDNIIVERDGRYCLAVKSDYKHTFKGIIHDSSQTRQTTYIEPTIIFEMANEKDETKNLEKEEVNLILFRLSRVIKDKYDDMMTSYNTFKYLDFVFGKAKLAKIYDGEKQNVNNEGILNLINARHPLLKVAKVIPNTLKYDKKFLGIVITGPNTGGKTVFLKTVGLLSLMTKFGLLIPASHESNVMLFDFIFCDIGDDQSITENLSTFSSHMKKMVEITNRATPNSLCLFDEIGSGTDPVEGAYLALSVLNYFIGKKISFIVTTHYQELKAFAYGNDLVVNASMQFDKETKNPTYHLIIGKSGSSNAMAIARNLGLKKEILDNAQKLANDDNTDIKDLMQKLEDAKEEAFNLKLKLQEELQELEEKKDLYDKKIVSLEQDKEKILNATKLKANKIIEETKDKASAIMADLDTAVKNNSIKLNNVIDLKNKVNSFDTLDTNKEKKVSDTHDFKVGDRVYLLDYENYGVISKISGKSYDIEIGNITIKSKLGKFKYVAEKENLKGDIKVSSNAGKKSVSLSLDLRGKLVEEARQALDKYIDDLLLAGIKQATIIHGFGTGRVREMVQDYLKQSKFVQQYRYGVDGEGGFGATVVTLK